MLDFNFAPWTIQYLIGIGIVLFILIKLIRTKVRTKVYQVFYYFGLSNILWLAFAFMHRNISSAKLSKLFFALDLFCIALVIPFILMMFIYFRRSSNKYLLTFIPALLAGLSMLIFQPFEIIWAGSSLGWTYEFETLPFLLYMFVMIIYLIITSLAGLKLILNTKGIARKKYIIILSGFFCATAGLILSNFILKSYPHMPPLGGVFVTILVLLISYAISLPDRPIVINDSVNNIGKSYHRFLDKIKQVIPGQELGERSFKFWDYVEAFGMEDMVIKHDSGKIIFTTQRLQTSYLIEICNNIINVVKDCQWSNEVHHELENILLSTYGELKIRKDKITDWIVNLTKEHGVFLLNNNLLANFPEKNVPEIFLELDSGATCDIYSDSNYAYEKLSRACAVGIQGCCITKYSPYDIKKQYKLENVDIIWLTFKNSKNFKNISPKDMAKVQKTATGLIKKRGNKILLIDCLKEIFVTNGIASLLDFSSFLKELCIKFNINMLIVDDLKYLSKEEREQLFNELKIDPNSDQHRNLINLK